jgi:hypothetical protein
MAPVQIRFLNGPLTVAEPGEVGRDFGLVLQLLRAIGGEGELGAWKRLDYRVERGRRSVRLGDQLRLLIQPSNDEVLILGIERSESGRTIGD